MVVRLQRPRAHPRQQLAKGRVAGQVRAQDQGVDEKADQPLHLQPRAPGDGAAHHHVLAPGVARQERLKGTQQHHVERGALAPAQRLQPRRQGCRHLHGHRAPAKRGRGRARMVRGQLQQLRRPGQPLPPVRQLPLEPPAGQPLALPEGVVGVLHGERGEGRFAPLAVRPVQRRQLAEQHAHAPPVAHHVVHAHHQHVVVRPGPQQPRAKERARDQVERPRRLLRPAPRHHRLALRRGNAGQVLNGEAKAREGRDPLHGPAAGLGKGGAQGLVAADDLAQGALQRRGVQRAPEPQRRGDVVGDAPGLQAVQEPEPLLRE